MSDHWVEGRFEGTYQGKRLARAKASDPARHFSFRLQSGMVHDVEIVDGPFPTDADATEQDEIRQDRVGRVQLTTPAGDENADIDDAERETSLFDVRIVDWRLSRPAEANGRSHGRIEGTIRARLTPPQPEPFEDDGPSPSTDEAQPTGQSEPPAHKPRVHARRREVVGPRSGTAVEGLDAETVYDRLIWLAAIALVLGVAAGLWSACGSRVAGTWLTAMGTALALRRLARIAIRAGSARQGWLAATLICAQALLWLEPVARGAHITCLTPSSVQIAALGAAVVTAGLLRGRTALAVTSLIWTAAACSWCVALNGACVAPTSASAVASAAASSAASSRAHAPDAAYASAPTEHRPAPRTSPDGHWPVMPGRRQGASGPGAAGSGGADIAGFGGGSGATVANFGGDSGATDANVGGASGSPSIAGGSGASVVWPEGRAPSTSGEIGTSGAGTDREANAPAANAITHGGSSAPPEASGATSTLAEPPMAAPQRTAAVTRGASAATRGGWVAADHRSASEGAVLISIEHANRVPDAFFGSGGTRRVYVPTDPIFEPGGSAIRSTGALQLGRIAALLDLHPERRVLLEVHTDVAGGLEAQQRSSAQRAASVHGWLLDRGHLDADQFEVIGAGGAYPLVPPDGSYAAQQPNRRIEISLID